MRLSWCLEKRRRLLKGNWDKGIFSDESQIVTHVIHFSKMSISAIYKHIAYNDITLTFFLLCFV